MNLNEYPIGARFKYKYSNLNCDNYIGTISENYKNNIISDTGIKYVKSEIIIESKASIRKRIFQKLGI